MFCNKCGLEKDSEHFYDTRHHRCKECHKKYNEARYSGDAKTQLRAIFNAMRRRCEMPHDQAYCNYGGRGIAVKFDSFESFYSFATTHGYVRGLDIDRIDNNGNYEPSNCRFVTRAVNMQNSRKSLLTRDAVVRIKGMAKTMSPFEIARTLNIEYGLVQRVTSGITWRNIEA